MKEEEIAGHGASKEFTQFFPRSGWVGATTPERNLVHTRKDVLHKSDSRSFHCSIVHCGPSGLPNQRETTVYMGQGKQEWPVHPAHRLAKNQSVPPPICEKELKSRGIDGNMSRQHTGLRD